MNEPFNPQPPSSLGRNQKLGLIGLVILACLIIYLGFRQMGNSIKNPFALKSTPSSQAGTELTEEEQMNQLKQKDTDKDGLSDYDELYVYQTSPYLADSDSDGIPDKTEIDKGTDPNCPIGKSCGAEIANPTAGAVTTSTLVSPLENMPSVDQLLLQSLFGANPDPKALRDFLIKQGIDKNTLDAFSDAELLQTFKEITTSATSTSLVPGAAPSPLPDFASLSAKELRDLLRQSGVSEEELNKISDEELLEMTKEIK